MTARLWMVVQIIGFLAGAAGAVLFGQAVPPRWGFAAFLVSNLAWLAFARAHRLGWLQAMNWVYLVTSVLGLWNWWLGPLVLG